MRSEYLETSSVMRQRRGICLVISSPSGGGKTSVINGLVASLPNARHSISYTTRKCRSSKDSVDYQFIAESRFRAMIQEGSFLEWAEVHGNLYGTHRGDLVELLATGFDVLLDIDVQGAEQIRDHFQEAVFVFLIPPSWKELEKRLRNRGSEDVSMIEKRLRNARAELLDLWNYDYVVINEELSHAIARIDSILNAERCTLKRFKPSREWCGLLNNKEET